jgi:hypothetical protein
MEGKGGGGAAGRGGDHPGFSLMYSNIKIVKNCEQPNTSYTVWQIGRNLGASRGLNYVICDF